MLSLDVGFCSTGYVVIEEGAVCACGVIFTEKSPKKSTRTSDDYYNRSSVLALGLADVIRRYEIQGVVGELPSGGAQSAKAMVMMNMATAIVASVCALMNIPCEWTDPTSVKLAVCGRRSASKDEMMEAVRAAMPFSRYPKIKREFEHIADAAGAYMAMKNSNVVKMFGGERMTIAV